MKFVQKLGKALMLPVACLPICGILMGLGYAMCPSTMQGGDVTGVVEQIGFFLVKAGGALIDHMALLFAIGVGVGMSDDHDGTAGLAALASWLMITNLLSTLEQYLFLEHWKKDQQHLSHSAKSKTHLSVSSPVSSVHFATTDSNQLSFLTGCHSSVVSVV